MKNLLNLLILSSISLTIKLSDITKITALQTLASSAYLFETGVYNDDIATPINKITLSTDTPSASASIRMNCYYEPIGTIV